MCAIGLVFIYSICVNVSHTKKQWNRFAEAIPCGFTDQIDSLVVTFIESTCFSCTKFQETCDLHNFDLHESFALTTAEILKPINQ